MSVSAYLRTLRSLDMALEAPASPAALTAMEKAIGYPLLDDLRALYQDHGGMPQSNRVPAMRLLPPATVVEMTDAVRRGFPGLLDDCAGLFWTDDNSNYAGVWLAPPLLGRVFVLRRDDVTNMPPKFRSVESFCQSMLAARRQHRLWFDAVTDYPRLCDPADTGDDEDRATAIACLRGMEALHWDAHEYLAFAYRALNLLPPRDWTLVLPLVESSNSWVQTRACETLGLWRCTSAVPDLLRIAGTSNRNGRKAAAEALRLIGTPEAEQALTALKV